MGANGMRRHAIVVGLAAAGVLLSVLGTGGGAALAATSGTIPGTLTAIPVSASYRIDQIFAGADGQMWFVTTRSQLGEISASGQATLTATALPHGTIPAQIAGAGPEGVWTFSNTYANPNATRPPLEPAGSAWSRPTGSSMTWHCPPVRCEIRAPARVPPPMAPAISGSPLHRAPATRIRAKSQWSRR